MANPGSEKKWTVTIEQVGDEEAGEAARQRALEVIAAWAARLGFQSGGTKGLTQEKSSDTFRHLSEP